MTGLVTSFTGEHAFLSSFWRGFPFSYHGITWPTAEHAFQAMKCPEPRDRSSFTLISTPAEAKKLGRSITCRGDWGDVKRMIMLEVVLAKFSQHGELRYRLAQTAPTELVEGNTWGDDYWGAVQGGVPPMPHWGRGWYGQNWLGRCLMMARDVLS